MIIMTLDIATYTGFAIGRVGEIPRSGSVRLKTPHEGPEIAAFNMRCFLRDRLTLETPDLVIIEDFLNPRFQKGAAAVILSIGCHFVARAELLARQVRHELVAPSTVRKHFCGAAHAGERADTKRMVIQRARMLGYIPRDCSDDNRADACAMWDWAAANYGGIRPKELVMFGERCA